ncbi:unnamed protein product, partial [Coccothraustes coccothraustes]
PPPGRSRPLIILTAHTWSCPELPPHPHTHTCTAGRENTAPPSRTVTREGQSSSIS